VNYPGKGSGISGSARWRRPVQFADAGRLVRSEYQVFQHWKLTGVLSPEPDPVPAEEEREEVSELLRTGGCKVLTGRSTSLWRCVMERFAVVRECLSRSLENLGRFRVVGEMIVIYLDGIGSFQVEIAQVIPVLLRLGMR
jgi:hypothetical protein